MTTDVELLPCPFCGEEMLREFNGALFVHPDPDSSECPIRFQEGYTDEDATAWNRRANVVHATAAKDAEIAELVNDRDDLLARLDASIDHGTKLGAAQQRCLDEILEQKDEIERLQRELDRLRGEHVRVRRDRNAAEDRAERLAEALRDAAEALQVAGLPGNAKQFRSMLRDHGQEVGNGFWPEMQKSGGTDWTGFDG